MLKENQYISRAGRIVTRDRDDDEFVEEKESPSKDAFSRSAIEASIAARRAKAKGKPATSGASGGEKKTPEERGKGEQSEQPSGGGRKEETAKFHEGRQKTYLKNIREYKSQPEFKQFSEQEIASKGKSVDPKQRKRYEMYNKNIGIHNAHADRILESAKGVEGSKKTAILGKAYGHQLSASLAAQMRNHLAGLPEGGKYGDSETGVS